MLDLFHTHVLMDVKCLCSIMLPAIKSEKVRSCLQQKHIKILSGLATDLNRTENCWHKIKYL